MTLREKKLFLAGVSGGVVVMMLAGGVLLVRGRSVGAAQPVAMMTEAAKPGAASAESQGTQPGTTLQMTPSEMTAAGVQVAEARTAVLRTNIDAFGRVEQPESQLAAVSAWIGGRIDKLLVQYTGERVRKGQAVAEVYSPEVATAVEELRLAQENRERMAKSDDGFARSQADALVTASQRRLELWGITGKETNAPAAGTVPHVTVYSKSEGTVVERKVTVGQYVNAGETLMTLADLSEIWIKVDAYEDQLPQIHPGQDVEIKTEALPDRTLHGHVQFIEPTANAQTRTVPVHVHLPNPGMRLLPGMFVSATFVSRAARPSVVVPRSAVLDTGTRKIVYLAKGDGAFEAREVQVGAPTEDVFPVMSGIAAGDRVVLNGNFLIDSQAQLSSGMSGLFGGSKEFGAGQPAGAGSAPAAAGAKVEVQTDSELRGGAENMFSATVSDAAGKAVSDATVTVTVDMPAMPAMHMPEMKNSFDLAWTAAQERYTGKGTIPSSGSWNVLVEARKNGAVLASAHTRVSAK